VDLVAHQERQGIAEQVEHRDIVDIPDIVVILVIQQEDNIYN